MFIVCFVTQIDNIDMLIRTFQWHRWEKNLIYNVLVYFNITQLIPQDYVITFITDKSLMFCDGCDFILSLLILILSKYFAEKGHYSISQILHINYVVII